jgi:hypothetical protein
MLKKVILTAFFLILSSKALADEIKLTENAPSSYVVKKGDTLWDISALFLKEPWLWPKLWRMNSEINNPHLIYPGDELRLVYDKLGQPMIVKGKPRLKWSPKVRTSLKNLTPINTIAFNSIDTYIKYDSIFSPQQLGSLPYVLGGHQGYNLNVNGAKLYVNGDLVVGNSYVIYQKEEPILDTETDAIIGYYATLVGSGKSVANGDSKANIPATLQLLQTTREIRAGDVVVEVSQSQYFPSFFTMQSAATGLQGKIIKAISGNREFAKQEVVFINLGKRDGLKQGDLLSVNSNSPEIVETSSGPAYAVDTSYWSRLLSSGDSQYNIPTERVGKIMVYNVFEQYSMALILHSDKPLKLQDSVATP